MANFDLNSYVDVQERINRFRDEYPEGAIITEIAYARDYDSVVVKAKVYRNLSDPRPASTGIAGEERGADSRAKANFTSWHENCETSAIGRALVNLGYAKTTKDRPSRQEMDKVVRGGGQPLAQREQSPPSDQPVASVKPETKAKGEPTPIITPLQKLHGLARLRGLEGQGKDVHTPLRCVCQFLMPHVKSENGYVALTSMTQLTDGNLERLYKQIEDVDERALLYMAVDYPAEIKKAKSVERLRDIWRDLVSIGASAQSHPELLKACEARKAALDAQPTSNAA